jgi:predicted ATP-grasp superfamily ATP-dependent carboligase
VTPAEASLQTGQVPAVVLGAELNGLGVIRSLASEGVRTIALDTDLRAAGMRTRYARKYPVRALKGPELVEDLIDLGQRFRTRPVLFITRESTVETVSHFRDELARWYRFTLPANDVLECLMHKRSFQQFCEQNAFCVPQSRHIVDEPTLIAARGLKFPVILKPAVKSPGYGGHFEKAYRIEDFDALAALSRRIMPILPDLIAQEWIDGADSDIYFCLQYLDGTGETMASFAGRKIRSWPPHTGGTASCVAAPEVAEELDFETRRFFQKAGFVGMGSMEFKRDIATGRFIMIEPTVGRTDYQEEVATLNGINIPFAAWRSELGLSPRRFYAKALRVAWRESATDRWSADLQNQASQRRALGKTVVDGWWRWQDPGPGLTQLSRRARAAAVKRLGARIGVAPAREEGT